jgi:hypothetical protein
MGAVVSNLGFLWTIPGIALADAWGVWALAIFSIPGLIVALVGLAMALIDG